MLSDIPAGWQNLLALLLVAGAFFIFVGAVGLLRWGDFYQRLHAPTKASTLGLGLLLIAALLAAWLEGRPGFKELLITLFVFITAPVSGSLLAQAALARRGDAEAPLPRHLQERKATEEA